MKATHIKFVLAAVFMVGVGAIAVVRVMPYAVNHRSVVSPRVKQITTIVLNGVAPQYEANMGVEEVADLVDGIHRKVNVSLKELPVGIRPSNREADRISSAFAGFVKIHRTGSRLEYLESYLHEVPPASLVNKDPVKADKSWLHSTAWARQGDVDIESIRVTPHFIRGQEIEYSGPVGNRAIRMLSQGLSLEDGKVGALSAYKIYLSVTVPSYDGKENFNLELGVMMLNDGLNGEWSPVSCEYLGVPMGTFVYTPWP